MELKFEIFEKGKFYKMATMTLHANIYTEEVANSSRVTKFKYFKSIFQTNILKYAYINILISL